MISVGMAIAAAVTLSAPKPSAALPPREFSELATQNEVGELVLRGHQLRDWCVSCHTFDRGGPDGIGPNLWNVVGARVARRESFSYSAALTAYRGEWTYERLESFLRAPSQTVAGTSMGTFAGMRSEDDVWAMIAYLRTLSDEPLPPLPSEAWIRPEDASSQDTEYPLDSVTLAPTNSERRRDVLRRGFQIYRQHCSTCHALSQLEFARLTEPGGPEWSRDEAISIAAEYEVEDRTDEMAQGGRRQGRLTDRVPDPLANVAEALSVTGGIMPPDLSMVLSEYQTPPPAVLASIASTYDMLSGRQRREGERIVDYLSAPIDDSGREEQWRASHLLVEGGFLFGDGGVRSPELMARDVVAFLEWADGGGGLDWRARRVLAIRVVLFWVAGIGVLVLIILAEMRARLWLNRHR